MRHLFRCFTTLIFCSTLFSCEPEIIEVKTMNHTRPIEVLKELVLIKGDSVAYDELRIAYLNRDDRESYLTYSLFMIHRYNYPRAYLDVYDCLASVSESFGGVMDERTKAMALKYLRRGADLNDYNSLRQLRNVYQEGKYVPKDTVMSRMLKEKIDQRYLPLKTLNSKD